MSLYITTPLYYVNDEPHIGHAYTTILADVLSRYQKLYNGNVHFLTGLDEHGQKVANAAAKLNITPQEQCNQMALRYLDVWEKLNIRYDDFIRTTEDRHQAVVKNILTKLHDQGDIYKKEYKGWYSVSEERFFTEKDLIDGKDPIGGRPVEKLKESNYFFRMSNYQDWLIEHYENNPDAVIPNFRLNEVKGFLRQPLNDLCISRPKSRLSWGIPIPWDADFVTYVWFDALFNYYSATITPQDGTKPTWPADLHIIGKDILTTHAVYWPTFLKAAGLEMPKQILAHGWWLAKNDAKMGKSADNAVPPLELAEKYGTDVFRYVLMREMVLGQDANFSEDMFVNRLNTDLANDLGNLYSRLAKVWNSGQFGSVPLPSSTPSVIPSELVELRKELRNSVKKSIDSFQPHNAIQSIIQVVGGLNRLMEQIKPWKVIKTDPNSMLEPLAWSLETLKQISELLEPVMPEKMADLQSWICDESGNINPQADKHLFPRIKIKPNLQNEKTVQNSASHTKPEITIDDFAKIDLRVGTVQTAQPHENADKLLVITVDLGFETRQIVAGIADIYQPDILIGKQVIIVANLKPVKLRGVLSQGMLLAVGDKKVVSLVITDRKSDLGSIIR